MSLRPVQPLPEPVDLHQPAEPQHGLEVEREIEEVKRQEAEEVNVEGGGVDVVLPQLDRVCLQDPVLQVSCSEVYEDVHQVNKVGEVIKREPDHHRGPLYFIKGGPVDNDLKDTFR